MLSGRDAYGVGHEVGRDHSQPIQMGLDYPGRERDREIAVEPGVRGMQRPRQAVVRALRHEVTAELVDRGVGHDDDERGVGRVLLEGGVNRERR